MRERSKGRYEEKMMKGGGGDISDTIPENDEN